MPLTKHSSIQHLFVATLILLYAFCEFTTPCDFFYLKPGAKRGLLIRGGDILERLAGIDAIVLDKVYDFIYHLSPSRISVSVL